MSIRFLSLILYPALADGLQNSEKEVLKVALDGVEAVDPNRIIDAIAERLSPEQMRTMAAQVPEADKRECFFLAKQIAAADQMSDHERQALEELRKALGISSESNDFHIPESKTEQEVEADTFEGIARRYSMIAGVVGFLPTPFISDFAILAPLQVYMVNRIAKFYNFPLDGAQLLKMVMGTVGLGYAFAVAARSILALVPVAGWALAGGIAFAGTYAIAIVAQKYIEQKGVLTEQSIKIIYREAYEEGKHQFNMLKSEIMLKKDELLGELKEFKTK